MERLGGNTRVTFENSGRSIKWHPTRQLQSTPSQDFVIKEVRSGVHLGSGLKELG
jgi:hypothetical protein